MNSIDKRLKSLKESAYMRAIEHFSQRLKGIDDDFIEGKILNLKAVNHDVCIKYKIYGSKNLGLLPNQDDLPSDPETDLVATLDPIPTRDPYEKSQQVPSKSDAEGFPETKVPYYKALTPLAKQWIISFIPPHKSHITDYVRYASKSEMEFYKIMRASLSFIPERTIFSTVSGHKSEDERFLEKIKKISSKISYQISEAILNNNRKIASIADECKDDIKSLIKTYEEEKQCPIDCDLKGKELSDKYFKNLNKFIHKEMNLEAEKAKKPTSFEKRFKLIESRYQEDLKQIELLKYFILKYDLSSVSIFVDLNTENC